MEINKIIIMVQDLISCLRKEGLLQTAAQLEQIAENREIWDRMQLNLLDTVKKLNKEKKPLSDKTRKALHELRLLLEQESKSPYEEAIYVPVRKIAKELKRSGFDQWERKLLDDLAIGSTATEIFMALRSSLSDLLQSKLPLPTNTARSATEILKTIQSALEKE